MTQSSFVHEAILTHYGTMPDHHPLLQSPVQLLWHPFGSDLFRWTWRIATIAPNLILQCGKWIWVSATHQIVYQKRWHGVADSAAWSASFQGRSPSPSSSLFGITHISMAWYGVSDSHFPGLFHMISSYFPGKAIPSSTKHHTLTLFIGYWIFH